MIQRGAHTHWMTILLAAVVTAALVGCNQVAAKGQFSGLTSTAQVTRGDMAQVILLAGQVAPTQAQQVALGALGGRVLEVKVQIGQTVQQGDPLIVLDVSDKQRELREAQASVEVARVALEEARREVGPEMIAQAEANLAQQEANLAAAKLQWELAQQAGLETLKQQVAEAQAALQAARDQLAMTELTFNQSLIRKLEYEEAFFQRALRDLGPNDDPQGPQDGLTKTQRDLASARAAREDALARARAEVTKAEAALKKAQTDLNRAISGEMDPAATARLAHEQANAAVAEAKRKLEELRSGPDSAAVEAAQTAYDAAVARVEQLQAAIDEAALPSPLAGVVFEVFVQPDTIAQPGQPVAYIADPSTLHVSAQAGEVDVIHLQVGQKVRLSFDAMPGQMVEGEIASISPSGQSMDGLTVYEVLITVQPGEGEQRVLPGMLASARVIVGEKKGVLTIPSSALRLRGFPNDYIVSVRSADGKTEDRDVDIGMNDGIMAEVLAGLQEGETVLIPLSLPGSGQGNGQTPGEGPAPVEPAPEQPVPAEGGK